MKKQLSLFEDFRLRLDDAIELSLASLYQYGQRYQHWAVAYSGGKDSSATVTFIAVDLINAEEETRIRELMAANTWPDKWTGDEIDGNVPIDAKILGEDGRIITQALLV